VPIVLPLVSVQFDHDRIATMLMDNIPHDAAEPVHREAVEHVVLEIAESLGPVRVRVTESDGSEFTDVILPKPSGDQPRSSAAAEPGLAGEGFLPDELVDIAVIIAQQTADGDGRAHLRLPPALLADIGGTVVLLGRASGAFTVCDTRRIREVGRSTMNWSTSADRLSGCPCSGPSSCRILGGLGVRRGPARRRPDGGVRRSPRSCAS
jgi:hypothetical protein